MNSDVIGRKPIRQKLLIGEGMEHNFVTINDVLEGGNLMSMSYAGRAGVSPTSRQVLNVLFDRVSKR